MHGLRPGLKLVEPLIPFWLSRPLASLGHCFRKALLGLSDYPRRNSSCLPSALQVSRLTRLASGQRSTPLAPQFRIWSQNSTKLRVVQVKSWITGLSLLDELVQRGRFFLVLLIRLHTRLPMICRAAFVSSARDCSDLNCKRCRETGLRHFAHVCM